MHETGMDLIMDLPHCSDKLTTRQVYFWKLQKSAKSRFPELVQTDTFMLSVSRTEPSV